MSCHRLLLAQYSLMGHSLNLHVESENQITIKDNEQLLFTGNTWGLPSSTIEMEQAGSSDWEFRFSDLIGALAPISAFRYEKFTVRVGEIENKPSRSNNYTMLLMKRLNSGGSVCFIQRPEHATHVEFVIPQHPSIAGEELLRRSRIILLKHNLSLIDIWEEKSNPAWVIDCAWTNEGTVAQALSACAILCAAAHTARLPETLRPLDIIHALEQNLISLLIGELKEGEEFDAKEFVDLSDSAGKIEFAKDVAQFANSPNGGLLLVGAKTEKTDGGVEYFKKISALDKNPRLSISVPKLLQRLRAITDQHVYPAVEGLQIASIEISDGQVIYVHIPPQNPGIMPFLVTGEMVSNKYFGEFYSIPRRRHDGNSPITAREIHRLIAGKLWE